MFETAIPVPHDTELPLRAFDWVELVARLDARRELRANLNAARHARSSFDPQAARQLFDQVERSINHNALERRKFHGSIPSSSPRGRTVPDREMS
ncbi:hypothetical protein F7D01_06830 [Erythrobacter sp. 3-20A1M]|nr:hypothetical protein F7D01_06830 [Erythrobacter sp. 3-20A1M]